MRVSIVGGGLVGLSLSVELARRGHAVTVYEPEPLARAAATRSAGLLVTILPDHLLPLALETREFVEGLREGLVRDVKALWIARDKPCMDGVLRSHERYGLNSVWAHDPGLPLFSGEHAALIEESIIDVGGLMGTIYEWATRLGVEIVSGARVTWRRGYGPSWKGETLHGEVVVAAGAWTGLLVPDGSEYFMPYRCQAASVEGANPPLPIEDDSLGYYIVPVSPNRSNIGDGANTPLTDPDEGFIPDPEDSYNVLERYAQRNSRAWESRVLQVWSAPCNTTGDGLPIVDYHESGVLVVSGLNGAGVTLGPALARIAADVLEASREPPSIFRFSPSKRVRPGRPLEPYDVCG